MARKSFLLKSFPAFRKQVRRLEYPSRRTHKHRFIDLHPPIIVLPIECRDLTPISPILQRIEVARSDARAAGVDASEMELGVFDEWVERSGEEGGEGGFGDVD